MLHSGYLSVLIATFIAAGVEMLEVDTIVIGVGTIRGWKSTLIGTITGIVSLAIIAIALGYSIRSLPLHWLRLVIGFLLSFGLGWLRKAIAAYASGGEEEEEGQADSSKEKETFLGISDWYAFTLAFKGTLLEGLEIVFITLSFGASSGNWWASLIGAGGAVVILAASAYFARDRIANVPPN